MPWLQNKFTPRLLYLFASLFFCLFVGVSSTAAQTISQCDLEHIYKDTVWYDPCSQLFGNACSVSVSVDLSGNDALEIAWNYFISQGYTPEQTAGLLGNFQWESSMSPRKNNGGELSDFPLSSNLAYGLAQWLHGRQEELVQRAKSDGKIAGDLVVQLEYVVYELKNTEKGAGDDLKIQTTVDGAALSVFSQYERAGDSTGPDRVALARQIYEKLNSATGGTSVGTPASSGGGCTTSVGPGQDTQYVNGFTVYSQYDPDWSYLPYSSSTIGDSGCGPAAMAMIITALTGQQVTPDQTASFAASRGLYVPGAGSSWSIGPVLADHWGLQSNKVGANVADISAALQQGALIIVVGKGALPFTSGGHFIVIRGVVADGNWLIGDSGHSDTSSQEWSPSVILDGIQNNGSTGSIYAISK